jgi:predicted nucleic acid-binding protein
MGRIVADATPIVYLAKIGKLDLLRQLYEGVIVPPKIREELFAGKHPEVPIRAYVDRELSAFYSVK